MYHKSKEQLYQQKRNRGWMEEHRQKVRCICALRLAAHWIIYSCINKQWAASETQKHIVGPQ